MVDQYIPFHSPYGSAMRFVDRVLAFDPSAGTISAQYTYSCSSEMIGAHSLVVGEIVPGVFLVEQAAQTAHAFTLLKAPNHPRNHARLVNVRADWIRPAPLNRPVTAEVLVRPAGADTSSFATKLFADETLIARVRGLVAFRDAIDA